MRRFILPLVSVLAFPLSAQTATRVNIVPTMVWVRFDNAEAIRLRCYAYTKAGAVIDGTCNWTSRNTSIITVTTPAKVTTLRAKRPMSGTWAETWVIAGRSGIRDSVRVRAVKLDKLNLTPPQVYCMIGIKCDTVPVQ